VLRTIPEFLLALIGIAAAAAAALMLLAGIAG
jgi:hypothetical protein